MGRIGTLEGKVTPTQKPFHAAMGGIPNHRYHLIFDSKGVSHCPSAPR